MTAKRWVFNNNGFHAPVDFIALKAAVVSHLFEVGPKTSPEIAKGMKGVPGVSRVNDAIRYLRDEGVIERENVRAPWRVAKRKQENNNT